MTTSDDGPVYEQDDAAQESGDDVTTTHADPMGEDLDEALAAPAVAAGGPKRWLLAILASLVAIVAGAAIWAAVYDWREQEYVGVSVLIGLAVGWLMRVVTKRSDIVVRLVAVLLTALGIVVGVVVGAAWFASSSEQTLIQIPGFWDLLPDLAPEWWAILTDEDREPITYVIFGAALLLAYLSAGPQSSKKKPATEPAPDDEVFADEPLADPLADPLAEPAVETDEDERPQST